MGQILGLGITHYPGLSIQGNLTRRIRMCLADPALPERLRVIDNWPEPMRREWSTDDGQAHSDAHREAMIDGFRMARRALDEFQPDFCVIWGDDQFENYREDCVPAFSRASRSAAIEAAASISHLHCSTRGSILLTVTSRYISI